MKSTFFIACRFFMEGRRAMALSSLGVIFGVAFFIAGQAQTQGFQNFFVNTILGSKGAVIITDRFQESYTEILDKKNSGVFSVSNPQSRKYYPGILDAERMIRELVKYPNVTACSPIVQKSIVLRTGFRSEVAIMQGIDLKYHLKASDFAKQLVTGAVEDFRDNQDAIAVGSLLADKLELRTGQNVFVVGPEGDTTRFKLTNIFETGVNAIDEKQVMTHRRAAQTTLQEPFLTSAIMVQLKDPLRAPQEAKAFEDHFRHRSRSWQDREKGTLQILQSLRISAGIGVSCIIMLAGFGIFNVLTMAVLQKTKEIAILRSMGYTAGDISAIFVIQGMGIAGIGIVLGWVAGAGLTWGISHIPIKFRGIFKADHFIVTWSFEHYLMAAVLALISVFIASYIPARRAAKIDPVNILRGSSS